MIKNDIVKLPDSLRKKKTQSNCISIFGICFILSTFHMHIVWGFFAFISSSYTSFWEGQLLIHETLFMAAKRLNILF